MNANRKHDVKKYLATNVIYTDVNYIFLKTQRTNNHLVERSRFSPWQIKNGTKLQMKLLTQLVGLKNDLA